MTSVCVCVGVYAYVCGNLRDQKRTSNTLELEVQVVMSPWHGCSELNSYPLQESIAVLVAEPSLLLPDGAFKITHFIRDIFGLELRPYLLLQYVIVMFLKELGSSC